MAWHKVIDFACANVLASIGKHEVTAYLINIDRISELPFFYQNLTLANVKGSLFFRPTVGIVRWIHVNILYTMLRYIYICNIWILVGCLSVPCVASLLETLANPIPEISHSLFCLQQLSSDSIFYLFIYNYNIRYIVTYVYNVFFLCIAVDKICHLGYYLATMVHQGTIAFRLSTLPNPKTLWQLDTVIDWVYSIYVNRKQPIKMKKTQGEWRSWGKTLKIGQKHQNIPSSSDRGLVASFPIRA